VTVTWYQHAVAYAAMKWPSLAAHSRASLAEALATVTPALTGPARGRPSAAAHSGLDARLGAAHNLAIRGGCPVRITVGPCRLLGDVTFPVPVWGPAFAHENHEGDIMAEHSNVARLRGGYAAFAKGDFAALDDVFAEDLLFHVDGRNQLTGDYRGREAVYGMFAKLMEITEGTFHLDVHTILADDEHGVALVVQTANRGGRSIRTNAADVMHLRDGKIVEFWTASTDQYAFDELVG